MPSIGATGERSNTDTPLNSTRLVAPSGSLGVALFDRQRGDDPDRLLAFAHAIAEPQPRPEAGHERGTKQERATSSWLLSDRLASVQKGRSTRVARSRGVAEKAAPRPRCSCRKHSRTGRHDHRLQARATTRRRITPGAVTPRRYWSALRAAVWTWAARCCCSSISRAPARCRALL
jgi:hypothetical protein